MYSRPCLGVRKRQYRSRDGSRVAPGVGVRSSQCGGGESGPWASDSGQWASDSGQWASDIGQYPSDAGPWNAAAEKAATVAAAVAPARAAFILASTDSYPLHSLPGALVRPRHAVRHHPRFAWGTLSS